MKKEDSNKINEKKNFTINYHINTNFMRLLWSIIYQCTGQLRRNGQFLKIHNLPRLNHEELGNLNWQIINTKI